MPSSSDRGRYEEHRFSKIVPGDTDTVRERISAVLGRFNYVVLGGNPIQAKRDRQRNLLVGTIREYKGQLTIGLSAISAASTLATFDYTVDYLFTKGDRLTLEREADAIIALASAPLSSSVCSSCGEQNPPNVRFCRVCGTPSGRHRVSPELEVMRLTECASAAKQEVTVGFVIAFLTFIAALPIVLLAANQNSGIAVAAVVLGLLGESAAAFFVLHGLRRLGQAFQPLSHSSEPQLDATNGGLIEEKMFLPERLSSVTEGTTELMSQPQVVHSPLPKVKDTDEIAR